MFTPNSETFNNTFNLLFRITGDMIQEMINFHITGSFSDGTGNEFYTIIEEISLSPKIPGEKFQLGFIHKCTNFKLRSV